jgi:hypothetical protein
MHLALSELQWLAMIDMLRIGCNFSRNSAGYLCYCIMTMSVNGVLMIFGLQRQVIKMSFGSW